MINQLRWRIALWLLRRAVRIAPDGSDAVALEDHILQWAAALCVERLIAKHAE